MNINDIILTMNSMTIILFSQWLFCTTDHTHSIRSKVAYSLYFKESMRTDL